MSSTRPHLSIGAGPVGQWTERRSGRNFIGMGRDVIVVVNNFYFALHAVSPRPRRYKDSDKRRQIEEATTTVATVKIINKFPVHPFSFFLLAAERARWLVLRIRGLNCVQKIIERKIIKPTNPLHQLRASELIWTLTLRLTRINLLSRPRPTAPLGLFWSY